METYFEKVDTWVRESVAQPDSAKLLKEMRWDEKVDDINAIWELHNQGHWGPSRADFGDAVGIVVKLRVEEL